ncbi:MAG: hypothetical protein Ct9H90mP25_4180 [Gammaproteobacteria bacterium]|nr:MAG: hypothetical protein Ct9H90mP25_4180 [Gammaproteobacteria bacterium]
MRGGMVWGVGLTNLERHVYDPQNGLPANTGCIKINLPPIWSADRNSSRSC